MDPQCSKATQEMQDLVWVEAAHGHLSIGSRPSIKKIQALRQVTICTTVVSLQHSGENLADLERGCAKHGLNWTNIQIRGANKHVLQDPTTLEMLISGLVEAKKRLEQGEALFIHCAAGIHRTGLFTYALLRIVGLHRTEALDAIRNMRVKTYANCGKFRFDLAEQVANQIVQGTPMVLETTENGFLDMERTDFLGGEQVPLLWLQVNPVDDTFLYISCFITNGKLTKMIEGPAGACVLPLSERLQRLSLGWLQHHHLKSLLFLQSKTTGEWEEELIDFLTSSTENFTCKLAGFYPHLEVELLEEFMPRVYSFLHYRVVDLCTLALLGDVQETMEDNEHPLSVLRAIRNRAFESSPRVSNQT